MSRNRIKLVTITVEEVGGRTEIKCRGGIERNITGTMRNLNRKAGQASCLVDVQALLELKPGAFCLHTARGEKFDEEVRNMIRFADDTIILHPGDLLSVTSGQRFAKAWNVPTPENRGRIYWGLYERDGLHNPEMSRGIIRAREMYK